MATPFPAAVVFVRDVARVSAFYRDLASMRVVSGDAKHSVLELDGFQLTVHALHGEAPAGSDPGLAAPRENSYVKLCFPVKSLAAARALAASRGGAILPAEREWEARGFRACDGQDPEGNVIQVRAAAASRD